MLKIINKNYLLFGTFIYVLIALIFPIELKALFALNYFTVLSLALYLNYLLQLPEGYFTRKKLNFIVFVFSAFLVLCYNMVSYYYNENFYLFSEDDSLLYHNESVAMAGMGFFKSIEYYLYRHEAEDLGMVIVLSTLYRLAETKLLLNVLYVIVAVATAGGIFTISSRFMSAKYAFVCAVSYAFSSYVIWFHASGLKESLLVMLVVMFYASYYSLIYEKKAYKVWLLILSVLFILLFRPVLSIFCVISVAMGVILRRKLNVPQIIFLFMIVFAGIYFLETIRSSTDKYLLGGTQSMLEIKEIEGMVKGSVSFTYLVNTLSSMFGPFPTIDSSKVHLSFFAPGLIYKIFLTVTFWFGLIYIIKAKLHAAYPLIIFVLLEMASLAYILEALELRKLIPHFPLIYIVSFIFISKFDNLQLASLTEHRFFKRSFKFITFVLCVLIVYWNFR